MFLTTKKMKNYFSSKLYYEDQEKIELKGFAKVINNLDESFLKSFLVYDYQNRKKSMEIDWIRKEFEDVAENVDFEFSNNNIRDVLTKEALVEMAFKQSKGDKRFSEIIKESTVSIEKSEDANQE